MKSKEEIVILEEQMERLKEEGRFEAAKFTYFQAARAGSGSACMLLAAAYHPGAKVFPDEFQSVFSKNRRRANRFSNRELKCHRKAAKEGDFRAMFSLYNAHHFGHPRLIRKSRHAKAELWLRKAAESGNAIPVNELLHYLSHKEAG